MYQCQAFFFKKKDLVGLELVNGAAGLSMVLCRHCCDLGHFRLLHAHQIACHAALFGRRQLRCLVPKTFLESCSDVSPCVFPASIPSGEVSE